MSDIRRYAGPQAFRRALTDRLRAAAVTGEWDLPQLQRQFAYDRLLARLYASDEAWVVKGATALIARGIAVRSTMRYCQMLWMSRGQAAASSWSMRSSVTASFRSCS
jgi:hypothetical protein